MNIYLVIPSIRNIDSLLDWDKTHEFESVHVIIVEDNEKKTIIIPKIRARSVAHYCHRDIYKDLGTKSWIFPHKSASIRSYGFYKAYLQGADIVITIDDDCYPMSKNFVSSHVDNLATKLPTDWTPTYPLRQFMYMRGFPYFIRNKIPVVLSHGLWTEIADMDGLGQLMNFGQKFPTLPEILHIIPKGSFFPMSSMNIAFSREVTVLMYQLLMGEDKSGSKWGYDRFDDIWCGIFAKKILDHLNLGTVSGTPFVKHIRASNVFTNINKEASGLEVNEELYKLVRSVHLTKTTPVACYKELIKKVSFPRTPYFVKLKEAMNTWISLFM